MRLICKTAFLVAIASTFACHDLAAPPALPAYFALENINGRPLPTFWSPIPESPTIVSSTVHLDGAGNATLTEHRLQMTSPGDVIVNYSYTYTIRGNEIAFDFDCPADANCISPPHGTISGSHLTLDVSGGSDAIVYNYALLGLD